MKRIFQILLLAFIVIQFLRPERNLSANEKNNISNLFSSDEKTTAILKKACNDCHSNYTNYPWYTNIQPVGWWLQHHVDEGKAELNFSEFMNYKLRRQYHKLEEIIEMVENNEMPLSSYTIIHSDARLNADEKNLLVNWAKAAMDTLKAQYPIDSLVRQKKN